MKLINNSANPLVHGIYKLPKDAVADIPDEIAKEWLKIAGIKQYVEAADLEKAAKDAKAEADAKVKAVEDENKKLKAELETLKAKIAKTEATNEAKAEAILKDDTKTKKVNK